MDPIERIRLHLAALFENNPTIDWNELTKLISTEGEENESDDL